MLPTIPGTDSTWIYYIDESHDAEKFCLVALGIRVGKWREAFEAVKQHRSDLRASDGVRTNVEIHARDLVSGRGGLSYDAKGNAIPVSRRRRAQIYSDILGLISSLPSMHIFNVCLDVQGRQDPELDAWDRLFNRLERTAVERNRREHKTRVALLGAAKKILPEKFYARLEKRALPYSAHVLIIADEGRQGEIARLRRKMGIINFVPSAYGDWGGGKPAKNIPLSTFVEDALFRDSAASYFIQLADCAAFALLKRETTPTPKVKKHGIQKLWDLHLRQVSFEMAAPKDPDGIVRK